VKLMELSEGLKISRHTAGRSANHGEKIASGFRSALIGRVFCLSPYGDNRFEGRNPDEIGRYRTLKISMKLRNRLRILHEL